MIAFTAVTVQSQTSKTRKAFASNMNTIMQNNAPNTLNIHTYSDYDELFVIEFKENIDLLNVIIFMSGYFSTASNYTILFDDYMFTHMCFLTADLDLCYTEEEIRSIVSEYNRLSR